MKIEHNDLVKFVLHHQLHRYRDRGKEGVLASIKQLGYLQIDTISVVERAHHHTLWNRVGDYRQDWLDELLAEDRAVFEHWGHAASYLPISDYRYSIPRMQRFPDTSSWERTFFDQHSDLMDGILERIRNEGALGARDFSDTRAEKPGNGWGAFKPEKIALELLLWRGDLMVSRRDKFQRIYDLRERILPDWVDQSPPTEEELMRHFILRSLAAMGIATLYDLRNYFVSKANDRMAQYLDKLVATGEVVKAEVRGLNEAHYLLPDALETPVEDTRERMYLLSPFDNLVIIRQRVKRIFGFDYTIECYVPPKKRVYGYWCLPMLFGDRMVGRIDCKADRREGSLLIQALHWEKGIKPEGAMKAALDGALDRFARFCGCGSTRM